MENLLCHHKTSWGFQCSFPVTCTLHLSGAARIELVFSYGTVALAVSEQPHLSWASFSWWLLLMAFLSRLGSRLILCKKGLLRRNENRRRRLWLGMKSYTNPWQGPRWLSYDISFFYRVGNIEFAIPGQREFTHDHSLLFFLLSLERKNITDWSDIITVYSAKTILSRHVRFPVPHWGWT